MVFSLLCDSVYGILVVICLPFLDIFLYLPFSYSFFISFFSSDNYLYLFQRCSCNFFFCYFYNICFLFLYHSVDSNNLTLVLPIILCFFNNKYYLFIDRQEEKLYVFFNEPHFFFKSEFFIIVMASPLFINQKLVL